MPFSILVNLQCYRSSTDTLLKHHLFPAILKIFTKSSGILGHCTPHWYTLKHLKPYCGPIFKTSVYVQNTSWHDYGSFHMLVESLPTVKKHDLNQEWPSHLEYPCWCLPRNTKADLFFQSDLECHPQTYTSNEHLGSNNVLFCRKTAITPIEWIISH